MTNQHDTIPVATELQEPTQDLSKEQEAELAVFEAMMTQYVAGMQESVENYMEREIDIPAVLQRGFYLSFRYSNGSPLLQVLLQSRIAHLITVHSNSETLLQDTASILPLDYESFKIPRAHGQLLNNSKLHARTEVLWDVFMQICQNVENPENVILPENEFDQEDAADFIAVSNNPHIPFVITTLLAERDAEYLIDGRPKRNTHDATYRSFIREYAIFDKSTGSAEFDFIMDEVRQAINVTMSVSPEDLPGGDIFESLQENVMALQLLWESRHQKPFYPMKK